METLDSSIFDLTPIPMWIEDFSEVKQQFDLWRKQGIENLHEFLNLNKHLVKSLLKSKQVFITKPS